MGKTALIVIDMINTYDHPDADQLLPSAEAVVPVISRLLDRARRRDAPVIYVNDNFGEWRSHHGELLDKALAGPYANLVEPLVPDESSSSWSRPGTRSSSRPRSAICCPSRGSTSS